MPDCLKRAQKLNGASSPPAQTGGLEVAVRY
jgi:hypothetical protein